MAMQLRLQLRIPLHDALADHNPSPWPGKPMSSRASSVQVSTQREREELLWQHLCSNPGDWWDNRGDKRSSRHPDFRHKTSKEPLWLDSYHKPSWVDSQLALTDWAGEAWGEDLELGEAVEALDGMMQRGCSVNRTALYRLIKRCGGGKDLASGRRIHSIAVGQGLGADAFLANHIIGMYAAHGELQDAVRAFRDVAVPDVYMWSSIISAHARHGQPEEAVRFYRRMRASGLEGDNHVFVAALKACASAEDLEAGKEVHGDIRASSVKADVFVGNSLVNMYAKCGSLEDARSVFDGLRRRDVVSWNAMIAAYSQQGMGREALALYGRMQQEGVTAADHVTFVSLLQACASVGALEKGREIHLRIRGRGLEGDAVIGNGLVNMYAKCGRLEDARRVFDRLPRRDVVAWNAMMAGYTQHGLGREALGLYCRMRKEVGMASVNHVTFSCLLHACASVGALQQGKEIHSEIRDRGLEGNAFIGSCLVEMYSKCGSLEDARRVFDALPARNLVTWTAMLKGYAEHSDGHMAIRCFEDMLQEGVEPDETTFICLMVACSHAGLVREGQMYFRMMVEEYGIVPSDYHHSCMVDLLGRSGQLDAAERLLQTTSFRNDAVGWTALLTACKSHGDVERGRRSFDHLVELEPENSTSYVLLGSIYANAGRWDDAHRIESLRKSAGAAKKAAKACIEVKNEVHEFRVGEERSDIGSKLKSVNTKLKEEGGHVPQTQLVVKPLSEQEKEDSLCGHAEKLALAYGLLNTPEGTTLLVTKNLRMCNDCHSSTKILSHLEKRVIIVRDAHRVHKFVEGSCSCGDRH